MGAFFKAKNVLFFPWKSAFFLPKSSTIPGLENAQSFFISVNELLQTTQMSAHCSVWCRHGVLNNEK